MVLNVVCMCVVILCSVLFCVGGGVFVFCSDMKFVSWCFVFLLSMIVVVVLMSGCVVSVVLILVSLIW